MLTLIVIVAQLTAAQIDAAKATYQKLPPADVEAKKLDVPPADAKRVDVSAKIRSASFGHKTWLLIAPDGTRFWIEWGKSTNTPAALFGPFALSAAPATPPTGENPEGGTTGAPGGPAKPQKVPVKLPAPAPTEGPKPAQPPPKS
jgi:hypothetical protein